MNDRAQDTSIPSTACACCMGRREFLAGAIAAAAALPLGPGGQAAAAAAVTPPAPAGKPTISVAFIRPEEKSYFMGWPGAAYDIQARQAEYTKRLTAAAQELGVRLDVSSTFVNDVPTARAFAAHVKSTGADGALLVIQSLNIGWLPVLEFLKQRGGLPTFVFSPIGTSFLMNIQAAEKLALKNHFIAATADLEWLGVGLRMLRTVCLMKQTRICVVQGPVTEDVRLASTGSTLHYIPFTRFAEEYAKVKAGPEIQAIADQYTKQAEKIVEPTKQDILEAAKQVFTCRRLMEREGCQGIAVDCLPHVKSLKVPPPCLSFSYLNDAGVPAACQADWPAALSLRLTWLLLDRPGFMQNIVIDTANNTLVGAHCTSPTRLAGPGQPAAPFRLRTHAESNLGVAMQVLWPVDREVTVMKFSDPQWGQKPKSGAAPTGATPAGAEILLGSGRVLRNIEPTGGCRTSLEVRLDGVDDVLKLVPLHHQLFILGNHVRKFKAYCQLAGIQVLSI